MSKATEYPMDSGRNEYFSAASLLSLHDGNKKESKQYSMGVDIDFKYFFTTNAFIHQRMIEFLNRLQLNNQEYKKWNRKREIL